MYNYNHLFTPRNFYLVIPLNSKKKIELQIRENENLWKFSIKQFHAKSISILINLNTVTSIQKKILFALCIRFTSVATRAYRWNDENVLILNISKRRYLWGSLLLPWAATVCYWRAHSSGTRWQKRPCDARCAVWTGCVPGTKLRMIEQWQCFIMITNSFAFFQFFFLLCFFSCGGI